MLSQEIRSKFLDYFKKNGHTTVPSSSVIPHEDPTLLFTNAGMNQFKDVFLGKGKRDYKRAATTQKCIRVGGKHNDLDNVGHTSRHLTFFEMLGNFSFGDYFKKEAIAFAWQITTEIFSFDPERIWVSVFQKDDQAHDLWLTHVKPEKIVRMDEVENFWTMGDTGPCGPCSELLFDRGASYSDAKTPKEDASGERFLEFWNLVFMEFNRDEKGQDFPLPNQSIDTGAGLERIVSLKMGVENVFHTDILFHLIRQVERLSGKTYEEGDQKRSPAFHVIADHLRSLAFSIADGAQPSNIERGYVLRKLIRRAVRYGRTFLGMERPFLGKIVPSLIEVMGKDFRELIQGQNRIEEILEIEEEGFIRTLKKGGNILSSVIEKALKHPNKQISAADAFQLKDTYGFPLEEVLLIAKDSNLQVNIDGYQILEKKAKELSRSRRKLQGEEIEEGQYAHFAQEQGPCAFVGYSDIQIECEIIGIVQNGEFIQALSKGRAKGDGSGGEGEILLKATPFYPEKGGQTADTGLLSNEKALFRVCDCQTPYPDVIVHKGHLEFGSLSVGDTVTATVDRSRRSNIAAHHTATHLLHFALEQIVGGHIRQAGSLVEEHRLRFDFNHHKPLTEGQIDAIEDLVNEKIREDQVVNTYEISFEEAQNRPEIKQFFGEKYGNHVRVVDIGHSKELCGGTHAQHVGMLGYFRITKEGSIAAGVRRIEACCGRAAQEHARKEKTSLCQIAKLLKTRPNQAVAQTTQLLHTNTAYKAQIQGMKRQLLEKKAEMLLKKAEKGILLSKVEVEGEELNELANTILAKMYSGIVVLAQTSPNKVQVIIKVSPDRVASGISAKALIQKMTSAIGGGGGGNPDSAQAGGKNPKGVDEAFNILKQFLK